MQISALPAGILDVICRLLTGFGSFYLSRTSSYWLQYFSDDLRTWLKHSKLSFDTWFFLLPATEDQVAGGIIFGGQSDRPTSDHSPQYYQPLVIVDSKFTLCCSVLADSEPVMHNLLPNRWYHLALTFEWDIRRQTVYLNGENVSCEDGILPRDWCRLSYQQVGTGYTRKHEDFPRRDPFGWYTFHGVVDAFRVWEGVLGAKAVQKLFQGGDLQEKDCVLKATIDRAEDGSKPWLSFVFQPDFNDLFVVLFLRDKLRRERVGRGSQTNRQALLSSFLTILRKGCHPHRLRCMNIMLPVDVLHAICVFLSGFDVFHFSHTNSWTLSVLSEDLYWQKRVNGDHRSEKLWSWKRRYMLERSLLFVDPQSASSYLHGMLLGCNRSRLGFAKFERPPAPGKWRGDRVDLRSAKRSNFSFDVWFCLFPGTEKQSAGGVIYGLQAEPAIDRYPGEDHGHFVMVDTKKNLYCSVRDDKKVVVQDLKPNCWYHLALTYNVELQRQEVYVGGKKVSTEIGPLNSVWPRLKYEQIGTGFCENTTRVRGVYLPHSRLHGGWYSFFGLIDEFHVWKGVLSTDAVASLAHCKQLEGCSLIGTIKRGHDRCGSWINTNTVRCTRPAEGKNVAIYQRNT